MGLPVLIRWAVMLRQVVALGLRLCVRWANQKTRFEEAYGSVGTSGVVGY